MRNNRCLWHSVGRFSAALVVAAIVISGAAGAGRIRGPLRHSENPSYFKDADGNTIILNGSHTWNNVQDWGSDGTLQKLNFDAYVRFLSSHGHNFTLLWVTELPRFCSMPTTDGAPPILTASPLPWQRTGPGKASDGSPKFDLTKFNPAFFERLRTRTGALNEAGIYAGVYLFSGEWINIFRCPDDGYPFTGANNINAVDDGYKSGKQGIASVSMTAPNDITRFQDAYVEKVIDALNDFPNVLWIVSEEAPASSTWWNAHQIAHVREYEARKPHQHPVGYAALIGATDKIIYDSDADWVAPEAAISPVKTCGNGQPRCKVNVNDSDHSYFGMWNHTPQRNRNYAWENFMNGNQVLFMDPYVLYYPREKRNLCVSPSHAICSAPDPRYENFRNNLGYILTYSQKVNLGRLKPAPELCSTKYCLAQTPSVGAEYLVYAPGGGPFTVNLSAMPGSRKLALEWFDPSTGKAHATAPIASGSASQQFTPPFAGDAVLYLVDQAGHGR